MKPSRNALAALAALATLAVLVVIAALAGERARKVIAVTLLSAIVCVTAASTAVIVRGGGKRKNLTTAYDVFGSDFEEDSASPCRCLPSQSQPSQALLSGGADARDRRAGSDQRCQ